MPAPPICGQWIILRTRPAHTLRLAESLAEDGFEVWTPVEVRRVRVPRMNARQIIKEPLLKAFLFAHHNQRHGLLALAEGRGRHVRFSVLCSAEGIIAKVPDRELDGLRWIEAQRNVTASPKAQRTIPDGVTVRVSAGIFGGMTGVVRRSKRGLTLVCFNGRYSAEIPTSLLAEDDAYGLQSATGGAALAA